VATPGEVTQMIGRAYQYVFIGALEGCMKGFENKFNVHTEPDKTSFTARTGKAYSFDFSGVYRRGWSYAEVLGECKGYSAGVGLLAEFRSFLAKVYVTATDNARHRNDYFWFVTNVPFACSEGSGIRNYEFVRTCLADRSRPEVREILGESHVDDGLLWPLVDRIGVFILTDSFLVNTDLLYRVNDGESIWAILKKFYGGRVPSDFGAVAKEIALKNDLPSPDRIRSGKRIRLSWRGIRGVQGGGTGGF